MKKAFVGLALSAVLLALSVSAQAEAAQKELQRLTDAKQSFDNSLVEEAMR